MSIYHGRLVAWERSLGAFLLVGVMGCGSDPATPDDMGNGSTMMPANASTLPPSTGASTPPAVNAPGTSGAPSTPSTMTTPPVTTTPPMTMTTPPASGNGDPST